MGDTYEPALMQRLESLTLDDPEDFISTLPDEHQSSAREILGKGDSYVQEMVNSAYLHAVTGGRSEAMDQDRLRALVGAEHFKLPHNAPASAFYGKVKEQMGRQRDARAVGRIFSRQAHKAGVAGLISAKESFGVANKVFRDYDRPGYDWRRSYQYWKAFEEEYKRAHDSIDRGVLKSVIDEMAKGLPTYDSQKAGEEKFGERKPPYQERPDGKLIFDPDVNVEQIRQTQEITTIDISEIADQIINATGGGRGKQLMYLSAIRQWGEAQEKSDPAFLSNLARAAGRGAKGFVTDIGTAGARVAMGNQKAELMRDLVSTLNNTFDPLEHVAKGSMGIFEKHLYGLIESVPHMVSAGTGSAGMVIAGVAIGERNAANLRAEFPDMDPGTAGRIGYLAAIPEMILEKVQADIAIGRFPWLMSLTNKISRIGARPGGIGVRAFSEYGVEKAQDIMLPLSQEIVSVFEKNVPDVDWRGFMQSYLSANENLALFSVVAPLGMIGSRAADYRFFHDGAAMMSDRQALEAFGFRPEAIERILAEQDPGTQQNVLRKEMGNVEPGGGVADIDTMGMPMQQAPRREEDGSYREPTEAGPVSFASAAEAASFREEAIRRTIPGVSFAELRAMPKTSANEVIQHLEEQGNVRSVSAPRVIRSMEEILHALQVDAPIRLGKLRDRRNTGEFWVRERVVRMRTANSLGVAAHEVAHAIDLGYLKGGKWDSDAGVSEAAQAELTKLGKDLYGEMAPTGGYKAEGFAEFTRILLQGGDAAARAQAPSFFDFFHTGILSRDRALANAIKNSQLKHRRFAEQGALKRVRSGLIMGTLEERMNDLRDLTLQDIKDLARKAKRDAMAQLVDSGAPIQRFMDEVKRISGKKYKASEDPFQVMSARRLTADSTVQYMVENRMVDFNHRRTGKSLKEAVAPVKKDWENFVVFLYAKRAEALWNDMRPDPETGKWVAAPRNPGITLEDAEYLVKELSTPAFERAAQDVYDWNNGVLEYAAQSSPDYARAVRTIREMDAGNYIPLLREFTAFDKSVKGYSSQKTLVRRLRGSGRRVKNPMSSMISNAKAIVLKANQKRVFDQIVKLARDTPDMGHMIVEIKKDNLPAAARTMQDLVDEINRRVPKEDRVELPESANPEEVVTFWAAAHFPIKKGENPVMPVYADGQMRWYEMDQGMYDALAGMDLQSMPKWVDVTLGATARTFRLGTTGLRASFSLATNPARDFRTLMLNSQSSAHTPQLFATWWASLRDAFLYSVSGGKWRADWFDEFERQAGKMSSRLGQDMRPTKRAARRLGEGWAMRILDVGSHVDYLRDVLQFPELASRATEFRLVARDIGWDPTTPMDFETSIRLANASKQVTTDFTSAGNLVRFWNQLLPFLNAGIQGPRAHWRAGQRDPVKFFRRALYGTALAIGTWAWYKDEDWWKEMTAIERYGYTWIPLEIWGRKELIGIPRSFEIDGIFMAGAQAILEGWNESDTEGDQEHLEDWLWQFVKNVNPLTLPPLIEETLEQAVNKDFYFRSRIVPLSEVLSNLPVEEQVGPYTTRTAQFLAKLGNRAAEAVGGEAFISPRRVDHAIRGILGGAGGDLAAIFGRSGVEDPPPGEFFRQEPELADFPVFGTFAQRGGQQPRRSRSMTEFYEALEDARAIQGSREIEETKAQREARLQLQDAQKALAALAEIRNLQWGVEERRDLDAYRTRLAREALADYKAGAKKRGAWRRLRRKVEKRLEKEEESRN